MGRTSDTSIAGSSLQDRVLRIESPIEWPPGTVAAYLIDGPEPVLVDAGAPGEAVTERFREALATRGYGLSDVEHVVVTHSHLDHIGQVPALLEADVRVYAPAMILARLRRKSSERAADVRETAQEVGLPPERVERRVERAVTSLERNRALLPPERVDVAFDFGEPFSVAERVFTPVHTPGHQHGHACLELGLGDQRVLFAGDALVEPFRAAALHVGLEHAAYEAIGDFHRGLERLQTRHAEHVFPGHGPPFDDYQESIDETKDRLDALVGDVEAAVSAAGPASPHAITRERVGEYEHLAPLLDTLGALGYLEDRGRVTFERDSENVRLYRTVE